MDSEVLLQNLKIITGNRKVTTGNLLNIIVQCMELVEKEPYQGSKKKKLVDMAVSLLIEQTVSDPEMVNTLRSFIPQTIDMVIAISKGLYHLNKDKFKCCF